MWNFPSLLEIGSKISYDYASRFQVSGEKPASTTEDLYIRKTGLWNAELTRPGFLWVVPNGQIPLMSKKVQPLVFQQRSSHSPNWICFQHFSPKRTEGMRDGGKHKNRIFFSFMQLPIFWLLTVQLYVRHSWQKVAKKDHSVVRAG